MTAERIEFSAVDAGMDRSGASSSAAVDAVDDADAVSGDVSAVGPTSESSSRESRVDGRAAGAEARASDSARHLSARARPVARRARARGRADGVHPEGHRGERRRHVEARGTE